jgi:adenylate cyclase
MGREIERKFLVAGDAWRTGSGVRYLQGYLSIAKERTVRIRIEGDAAVLTVKGITEHAARDEYEYSIPVADARAMLDTLCLRPLIEKRRYRVEHRGMTPAWSWRRSSSPTRSSRSKSRRGSVMK